MSRTQARHKITEQGKQHTARLSCRQHRVCRDTGAGTR